MGFPFGSSTILLLTFDLNSSSFHEKYVFEDDSFNTAIVFGTSSFLITSPRRFSASFSCTSISHLSFSICSPVFIATFSKVTGIPASIALFILGSI